MTKQTQNGGFMDMIYLIFDFVVDFYIVYDIIIMSHPLLLFGGIYV